MATRKTRKTRNDDDGTKARKFLPQIVPPPPTGEKLEYHKMLQEAILFVTRQLMEEKSALILKRAHARVETQLLLKLGK